MKINHTFGLRICSEPSYSYSSIVFQLGALYHAILLIRITGKRTAWLLISCVVFMMLVRRIGWLINLYFMEIALPYEWLHELVTPHDIHFVVFWDTVDRAIVRFAKRFN